MITHINGVPVDYEQHRLLLERMNRLHNIRQRMTTLSPLDTPTAAAPPKPSSCCVPLACATPGLDAAQLPGQVRAVVFLALALALVSALAAIAWVLLLFGVPAR